MLVSERFVLLRAVYRLRTRLQGVGGRSFVPWTRSRSILALVESPFQFKSVRVQPRWYYPYVRRMSFQQRVRGRGVNGPAVVYHSAAVHNRDGFAPPHQVIHTDFLHIWPARCAGRGGGGGGDTTGRCGFRCGLLRLALAALRLLIRFLQERRRGREEGRDV